jgi:hypothetical protein
MGTRVTAGTLRPAAGGGTGTTGANTIHPGGDWAWPGSAAAISLATPPQRPAASGKRPAASGKRQAASGKRQAASGLLDERIIKLQITQNPGPAKRKMPNSRQRGEIGGICGV